MPLPDFFIMLDKDPLALQELKNLQVPLIGFVDTNMNPDDFIYKLLGNNDSVKNLEFFFEFLLEAVKEGRLKEQQLFFFYLIYNIKKKLYKTKKITKITAQSFSKKKFNKNIFIKNNNKSFLKKSKNFEINSNVLHKEKNSSNIISEKDTHGKKH
jgi:ribosomal protein S2